MAETLGKKIKRIRKQHKLTQKQLSDGICTQALISMFESDETVPSSVVLYKIAKKLNVTLDYFFEETRPSTKVTTHNKDTFVVIRTLIQNYEYHAASIIVEDELKKGEKPANELAFLYWHKGICIWELQKDHEQALRELDQAIELVDGDYEMLVSIYNSMAIIFFNQEQYDNAIAIYTRCIELFEQEELANGFLYRKILFGLSRAYLYADNFNAALQVCERGIRTTIQEESLYLLGELLFQKGRIYRKTENLQTALQAFQQAKVIFQLEGKIENEQLCERNIQKIGDVASK